MWILALNVLWSLPIAAFAWARRHSTQRVWRYTGAAFGLVVEPAGMALYGLYFSPLTAPLGIVGLLLTQFHGEVGYRLAISLGLVEPATVVRGVQHVYITVLSSVVWAPVYGVLGLALDLIRLRRRAGGLTSR